MNESSGLQGQHFGSCVASQAPLAKGSRPSDFPVGTVKAYCKSMILGGIPHTDRKALAFISRLQVSSGFSKDAWRGKVRTRAGRTRVKLQSKLP